MSSALAMAPDFRPIPGATCVLGTRVIMREHLGAAGAINENKWGASGGGQPSITKTVTFPRRRLTLNC